MDNSDELMEIAKAVLQKNQHGSYTVPAEGQFSHQWLWDSCFITIGLRHYDIERAKKEIYSLLHGQWANGMLPHMIFASSDEHRRDQNLWRSWTNPYAPEDVSTSGITQPPVLAEAIVCIGEKMKLAERRTWYQTVFPALYAYHEWLYRDRDPHAEGLVLQIHPWETGLDNTPPWMDELYEHEFATWVKFADNRLVQFIANRLRRDGHHALPGERLSTFEGLALYSVQRRLRRKSYDIDRILNHSLFAIEDLSFNAILVRANEHLLEIAKTIHEVLPEEFVERTNKTKAALETLWDAYSGQYYSRNFITHRQIQVPSIATLMPLYAGSITAERAQELVTLIYDKHSYGAEFPLPSVPLNSPWFKPHGYWQGPVWVNMNWMIIDGLNRYGFKEEANALKNSTLEMVHNSGMSEYFSPLDASPAGAANFSWTAALTIDLLSK